MVAHATQGAPNKEMDNSTTFFPFMSENIFIIKSVNKIIRADLNYLLSLLVINNDVVHIYIYNNITFIFHYWITSFFRTELNTVNQSKYLFLFLVGYKC